MERGLPVDCSDMAAQLEPHHPVLRLSARNTPHHLHHLCLVGTNAIESVNMSLRKISNNPGSFPNDEALSKLFYLVLININKSRFKSV
ncbi:hypothetical protein MKLM6_2309 [Methylomonas koyamae]|nr:hypothetical protein MKLM6_2309 [Methylomonas koyamae]